MHLCAELTAASWILELFGEVRTNFSLQLSLRTQFGKIKNKKVIIENQCEKYKTSSLERCSPSIHTVYILLAQNIPFEY